LETKNVKDERAIQLLEKMFIMDPSKRIKIKDILLD
jgi:hypothetical protein